MFRQAADLVKIVVLNATCLAFHSSLRVETCPMMVDVNRTFVEMLNFHNDIYPCLADI